MDEKKPPLVSVLMPTYNHERFIAEAIQSVLEQTYPAWELIVVDDGSTDRTRNVIEECIGLAKDSRLRFIAQEHRGPSHLSATYNGALAHARGELIAILEGDDLWPPSKLEMQVPDFAANDAILSFGDYAWIDPNGRPIRTVRVSRHLPRQALTNKPVEVAAWYMAGLAYCTFTFPCTVVIRRSALEAIGGFHGLSGPVDLVDFPTFLELSLHGRFAYHERILGYWRRHLRSLTTTNYESIYRAARAHSLSFLGAHPESQRGDLEQVHTHWERALAYALFTQARAKLVAGERGEARQLLRRLVTGKTTPLALRGVAVLGLLAALVHSDLEPVMRVARGYSLRRMKS